MKHNGIIIFLSLCGIYSLYSMEFRQTNRAAPQLRSSSSSNEEEVAVQEQREVPNHSSTATAALQAIQQVNQYERDLQDLQNALVGKTFIIGTTQISFKKIQYLVTKATGTCSNPGSLTLSLRQTHLASAGTQHPTKITVQGTWQTTRGDGTKSPCAQQGADCVKVISVTNFEK